MTLPLALTMGEPAGIGGEIALQAWLRRVEGDGVPPFLMIDDPARLEALARDLALPVPVRPIDRADEAAGVFGRALPVLPEPLPRPVAPGRPDPANAPAVVRAIERAVRLVQAGEAAAVVTNPIHKRVLGEGGFAHPGHTEFLADLAGADLAGNGVRPVMMLACPGLRVVPVTIHQALRRAIDGLTPEMIADTGRITARALRDDFGIHRPRLAVAGLNPHAGEDGTMGEEEITVIAPALETLRMEGVDVRGPLPADGMFHDGARAGFDAALCMYHDQALIPLKTLDFARGVNVTLGLPFVRTSPDHGTAFSLAGSGEADPRSLIAALSLAAEMAAVRGERPS